MTQTCSKTWIKDELRGGLWYSMFRFSCGGTITDQPKHTFGSFSYCPFCGKPLK